MTTNVAISDFITLSSSVLRDPVSSQQLFQDTYTKINDGTVTILNASNPIVNLAEFTTATVCNAMNEIYGQTCKLLPNLARTQSDLYLHMSDTDYINVFAKPSYISNVYIAFNLTSLVAAMVLDPEDGLYKAVIPRNTYITVNGINFSLQYPVIIRQMPDKSIQAVYDTSVKSPLQTISQNIVPIAFNYRNATDYITLTLSMYQFNIITGTLTANESTSPIVKVTLTDSFYYARIYVMSTDGTWAEIQTTYTQEALDPTVATAVISVTDNIVTIKIPNIYITNNIIRGKIRYDIYETKGNLQLDLSQISTTSYTANWLSIDANDSTVYTAAIASLTEYIFYSDSVSSGGRDALTFTELRNRVLNGSYRSRSIPITNADLIATAQDASYNLNKAVDLITNRAFKASRNLPAPTVPTTSTTTSDIIAYTPANAMILNVTALESDLVNGNNCLSHSTGFTINSGCLLSLNNGIGSIVSKANYAALKALQSTDLVTAINNAQYSYTPFTYVLNISSDTIKLYPFYLDSPYIETCTFIKDTPTSDFVVDIASTSYVNKTATGFQLVINTISNAAYKALDDNTVGCQLSFTNSKHQGGTYTLKGIQVSRSKSTDERQFVFSLNSLYDIDSDLGLLITNLYLAQTSKTARVDLTQAFQVLFTVKASETAVDVSAILASYLNTSLFTVNDVGIALSEISVSFGKYLKYLWSTYTADASAITYQTYTSDVPLTYTTDVYDTSTSGAITIVNGIPTLTKLHSAGEQIYINGIPQYLHKAGDVIYDATTGLPIPIDGYQSSITYGLEIYGIDASYHFATDSITTAYVKTYTDTLVNYITADMSSLNEAVIDKTTIYYYPQETEGLITVKTSDNITQELNSAQSLTVDLYLTQTNLNNDQLINKLKLLTIETINAYFNQNTVISNEGICNALRTAYTTNVVSFKLTGLGGSANYPVLTVISNNAQLSINKSLSIQSDGNVTVVEDIIFNIYLHN